MTAQELIAFETSVKDAWESGELPCLLHLCGGNEWQLLNIFRDVKPGDWVFSTHRNHYHALMTGIPADAMTAKIRDGRYETESDKGIGGGPTIMHVTGFSGPEGKGLLCEVDLPADLPRADGSHDIAVPKKGAPKGKTGPEI